jgi:glycosyltransferase involved in cell wall biosynthesis
MDGGSLDKSPEIIEKYDDYLTYWVSEPDRGQSSAINAGLAMATGDILCWLNSDDMLMPGALQHIASVVRVGQAELVFGNCVHFGDTVLAAGSDVRAAHECQDLLLTDYVIQPSSFWTKEAWQLTGPLDESLAFGFDWEWFIRAQRAGVLFTPDDRYLSMYRKHGEQKTHMGGSSRLEELGLIYSRHAGPRYENLFTYCCRRRNRIRFILRWVRRLRLVRDNGLILKLAFPVGFHGYGRDEVRDVVRMV